MEINTREINGSLTSFLEVKIKVESTEVDLGFNNLYECEALQSTLSIALDEVEDFIERQKEILSVERAMKELKS